MHKLFSITLAAFVFASCQSSGDRMDPVQAPTTFTPPQGVVLDSNKPGTVTSTPATTGGTSTAALNPEHGALGHRCDIPVGAPLNSPVGGAPVTAPSGTQVPMMIKTQTPPPAPQQQQPINGNVRLNPAHGQPGHDCSIPVGQPLRS